MHRSYHARTWRWLAVRKVMRRPGPTRRHDGGSRLRAVAQAPRQLLDERLEDLAIQPKRVSHAYEDRKSCKGRNAVVRGCERCGVSACQDEPEQQVRVT